MSESLTVKNLCIEMIDEIQRIKRNLKDSEDRLSYLQDRFRGELDGEFTFDEVLEKIEKLQTFQKQILDRNDGVEESIQINLISLEKLDPN